MRKLNAARFRFFWIGLSSLLLLVLAACGSPPVVVLLGFGAVNNPENTCAVGNGIPVAVDVANTANLPLEYQWVTDPIPAQMSVSSPRAPAGGR